MITDEKIIELIVTISAQYGQLGSDALIPSVREWLKENKMVDGQEWLRREKDRLEAEEYECAMMSLDKLNVPRIDPVNNKTHSLVGRIKLYKEM
ncbi:MAG: hypothetical protein WC549_02000 [Actinomycetota bacterium]